MTGSAPPARERRWLFLAAEGSHSWLVRERDPEEDAISSAEASLCRADLGGWLAVREGDYWSRSPLTLMEVRALNAPLAAFAEVVERFLGQ